MAGLPQESQVALNELRAVKAAGALDTPDPLDPAGYERGGFLEYLDDLRDEPNIPFSVQPTDDIAPSRRQARWEGVLAASLLGQLEAFPYASMDVILDVRERLKGPRTHFRAAMMKAAKVVAESGNSGEDLERVVVELRSQEIEPALQHIREELDALHVRRTLLRVASDRVTLASAAASIAMAAGAGGGLAALRELVQGALMAPLIAAAAKEADFRETKKAELRIRPYWLLREADDRLRRASG